MSPRLIHERLRAYWEGIHGVADLDDHRPSEPPAEPPPVPVHPSYREIYIARVNSPPESVTSKATGGGDTSSSKPPAFDPAPELTAEEIAEVLEALGVTPEKPKRPEKLKKPS
jgi:hypothetical protein